MAATQSLTHNETNKPFHYSNLYDNPLYKSKMHSNDRVIVLKAKEGATVVSSGLTPDHRLFTGENKLHVVMDEQTSLWSMHYEQGAIPAALKGNFTSFRKAYEFARAYYERRNVEIIEVID